MSSEILVLHAIMHPSDIKVMLRFCWCTYKLYSFYV